MARKAIPPPTTCPGGPAVHRGFCCFGRKAERAMGTKNTHRCGGSFRGGLKDVVGKARSRLSRTPSPADEKKTHARAVVIAEALIESDHDAEMVIKAQLRNGIDEVTVKETGGKRTYANPAGHGFEQKVQEMNQKLDALLEGCTKQQEFNATLMAKNTVQESINASLMAKNTVQESVNASLSTSVAQLKISSKTAQDIRWRMYDVYKRDIKGMDEVRGSSAIRAGNAWAHNGDALTDAVLFQHDIARQDRAIYLELYGWHFEKVLGYRKYTDEVMDGKRILSIENKLNDHKLFTVLNAHANMLLQGKPVAKALDAAFNTFLSTVERFGLEDFYMGSPVHKAYYAFWNEHPSHNK